MGNNGNPRGKYKTKAGAVHIPYRNMKHDYHDRKLSVGDIVEHVLDGASYRITGMQRMSDSAYIEPVVGSKRAGFVSAPCECLLLIEKQGELNVS